MKSILTPSTAASVAERVYDIRKLNTFRIISLLIFEITGGKNLIA